MLNISSGRIAKPQKVVVYGPEGIGKSTFAAQFPDPVFIGTEGSTYHMDVKRTNKPQSWQELMEQVQHIAKSPGTGIPVWASMVPFGKPVWWHPLSCFR